MSFMFNVILNIYLSDVFSYFRKGARILPADLAQGALIFILYSFRINVGKFLIAILL